MFRNYLKIAFRSLWKNKTASIINITGLTVGLTCCLLMTLYLQHELSYDKFQAKGDRIVRLIMEYNHNDGAITRGNFTSTKVLPTFREKFPEVEDGVRMTSSDVTVKSGEELYSEPRFMYADSTFFNLFPSFRLLQGDPTKVLKDPKMLVLSASTARKYFGNENAVGKILQIGSNQENYTVTGVTEDCPSNSQIKFDLLASFSSLGLPYNDWYWNANYTTFLLLKDKKSIASFASKIGPFMKKETAQEPKTYINFIPEPFTSIHLHSPYNGFEPNSNISYVYISGGIALLILIIACFTYINLSTSRSMERAKEVGVRKVSGALRTQLFWQFICESAFLALISMILSFAAAAFFLPAFNRLSERSLTFNQLLQPAVLITAVLIIVTISLLAGSYPALILSRFQPVKVLKGAFRNTNSGALLRRSLIVFQFTISAFLLIATFILEKQLSYIQNKNLGFDREQVLVMRMSQKMVEKVDLVKTELKTNPDILAVSKANNTPVSIVGGYFASKTTGSEGGIGIKANPIDDEYAKVNGLEIIAGSDLSHQDLLDADQTDNTKNYYHYLINESAAAAFGWTAQSAIGQKLYLGEDRPGEVKGVLKDFHFASLHTAVQPVILFPGWGNNLMVKISGKNIKGTIAFLEKKWKELAPEKPFEFRFLSEDFNKLYISELRAGRVFSVFSAIAILLACLGLFGLSAYTVQQRTKEIGIRKVLGASASGITVLVANQFLRLVIIAFIIAAPIAWYAGHKWLEDFAYRIQISWYIFIITGVAITLVALITVSFQAIRAAMANPIKSLRTE